MLRVFGRLPVTDSAAFVPRYYKFESISLQRGVRCELFSGVGALPDRPRQPTHTDRRREAQCDDMQSRIEVARLHRLVFETVSAENGLPSSKLSVRMLSATGQMWEK
jgi:hypothetical protein